MGMSSASRCRYSHGLRAPNRLISSQPRAPWKSWAEGAADEKVVLEIPDRCFAGVGITEHIIRVAIAIEVAYGPARQASTSVV
jgi:hypothetical protein